MTVLMVHENLKYVEKRHMLLFHMPVVFSLVQELNNTLSFPYKSHGVLYKGMKKIIGVDYVLSK